MKTIFTSTLLVGTLLATSTAHGLVTNVYTVGPGCAYDSIQSALQQALDDLGQLPSNDTLEAKIRLRASVTDTPTFVEPIAFPSNPRLSVELSGGWGAFCSGRALTSKTRISAARADAAGQPLMQGTGVTVSLDRLDFAGPRSHSVGVFQSSVLQVNDVRFADGDVQGLVSGGALQIDNTSLSIRGKVVFENNHAASGGAIFCFASPGLSPRPGAASVSSSIDVSGDVFFLSNSANAGDGGAVYLFNSCFLSAQDAVYAFNDAAGSGGAIASRDGSRAVVSGAVFDSNRAPNALGGHIAAIGSGNVVAQSTFFLEGSALRGGAVGLSAGPLAEFVDSHFLNNSAEESGGAISSTRPVLIYSSDGCVAERPDCTTLLRNQAQTGAVVDSTDDVTIKRARVSDNISLFPASAYTIEARRATIENVLLDNNRSVVLLHARVPADLNVRFSTIVDNEVFKAFDGIYEAVAVIASGFLDDAVGSCLFFSTASRDDLFLDVVDYKTRPGSSLDDNCERRPSPPPLDILGRSRGVGQTDVGAFSADREIEIYRDGFE